MTAIRWTWWHTVAAISLVVLLVIATTGCGQCDDVRHDARRGFVDRGRRRPVGTTSAANLVAAIEESKRGACG